MFASFFWEKIKDSLYGCQLGCLAFFPASFDEEHGIACIDFADIVNQEHGYDLA